MNFEQERENLIVQLSRKSKALVFPLTRHLSSDTKEYRILLTDALRGVQDLLGLPKHLTGEDQRSEEQEQCPNSADREGGGKR
jgi:hypothetical protein